MAFVCPKSMSCGRPASPDIELVSFYDDFKIKNYVKPGSKYGNPRPRFITQMRTWGTLIVAASFVA
jgi:hypothetical protein